MALVWLYNSVSLSFDSDVLLQSCTVVMWFPRRSGRCSRRLWTLTRLITGLWSDAVAVSGLPYDVSGKAPPPSCSHSLLRCDKCGRGSWGTCVYTCLLFFCVFVTNYCPSIHSLLFRFKDKWLNCRSVTVHRGWYISQSWRHNAYLGQSYFGMHGGIWVALDTLFLGTLYVAIFQSCTFSSVFLLSPEIKFQYVPWSWDWEGVSIMKT